jgi:hypothetical protein
MREPTSAPAVSSGDMAWVISVSWFGSLFVSVSGPLEDRRLRASIWDQGLATFRRKIERAEARLVVFGVADWSQNIQY